MNFWKSLILSLSLYTRIPMPFVEWDEAVRKRMLYFLPVSGLLIGIAESLWLLLFCAWMPSSAGLAPWLYAVVACGIPLFLNGGIHMDGLADTADALASHAAPERKRAILKDPHIGAFGVLAVVLYVLFDVLLLAWFFDRVALAAEDGALLSLWKPGVLLASAFLLSRALTQLAVSFLPAAAEEGMLYAFTSMTDRSVLAGIGLAVLAAGAVLWALLCGLRGLWLLPVTGIFFAGFCWRMRRAFGGISGDLCGRLIQLSELLLLFLACIAAGPGGLV